MGGPRSSPFDCVFVNEREERYPANGTEQRAVETGVLFHLTHMLRQ